MSDLLFFDRSQEYAVIERRLPHWSQAGVVCFLTWRLADSLPRDVVEHCLRERDEMLRKLGIDPRGDWRRELQKQKPQMRDEVIWKVNQRWDTSLDECHGSCPLRRSELSQIVADNLMYLDGQEYELTDFVVMPNHVHVLATFTTADAMLRRSAAWRRYQARQINQAAGRSGHLWQEDGFDHLVRSAEQFDFYRRYIAENPKRAKLKNGECRWQSKKL